MKDFVMDSGLNVCLVVVFVGWKGIFWLCWVYSDLCLWLVLYVDYVEFCVICMCLKVYFSIFLEGQSKCGKILLVSSI